jgi:hypothetical protein
MRRLAPEHGDEQRIAAAFFQCLVEAVCLLNLGSHFGTAGNGGALTPISCVFIPRNWKTNTVPEPFVTGIE